MSGQQLPQRRILWLSLAWAWLGVIVYLSLTSLQVPVIIGWQDKLGHVFMYSVPMWWFIQLYPKQRHWLIGLGLFLLGAGLEFAQSFHPLRYMDYYDAMANGLGILTGWMTRLTPLSQFFVALERRWSPAT